MPSKRDSAWHVADGSHGLWWRRSSVREPSCSGSQSTWRASKKNPAEKEARTQQFNDALQVFDEFRERGNPSASSTSTQAPAGHSMP